MLRRCPSLQHGQPKFAASMTPQQHHSKTPNGPSSAGGISAVATYSASGDAETWMQSSAASLLIERCMNSYKWDEKLARRVLAEYIKFVGLKNRMNDINEQNMVPPYLIHSMWQAHYLDSKTYAQDIESICGPGRYIHINHYSLSDPSTKPQRVASTETALTAMYGTEGVDKDIWTFYTDATTTTASVAASAIASRARTPTSMSRPTVQVNKTTSMATVNEAATVTSAAINNNHNNGIYTDDDEDNGGDETALETDEETEEESSEDSSPEPISKRTRRPTSTSKPKSTKRRASTASTTKKSTGRHGSSSTNNKRRKSTGNSGAASTRKVSSTTPKAKNAVVDATMNASSQQVMYMATSVPTVSTATPTATASSFAQVRAAPPRSQTKNNGPMKVSIKNWENKVTSFNVAPGTTVGTVKSYYANHVGMADIESSLLLFYESCPLPEDKPLSGFGIKQGDTIEATLELEPIENVFGGIEALEEV